MSWTQKSSEKRTQWNPSAGDDSPWDALQVGYFLSYGMWNYLTTPSCSPQAGRGPLSNSG